VDQGLPGKVVPDLMSQVSAQVSDGRQPLARALLETETPFAGVAQLEA
jgi:hypothetical protein